MLAHGGVIGAAGSSISILNLLARWKLDEGIGGSIADSSGNGYTATAVGSPSWASSPTAIDLSGSGQYINCTDIAAIDGASALTVSGWIWQDTNTVNHAFFSKYASYASDQEHLDMRIFSGETRFQIRVTASIYAFTPSSIHTTGVWEHFAMVFDGSGATNADRMKFYLNNVARTLTFTGTIPATLKSSSTNPLLIGGRWGGAGALAEPWDGKIRDVIVFTRALSSTEIGYIYDGLY